LVRFRQLVTTNNSAAELQAAVKKEFVFYQSIGKDNKGTVTFTGYYEPIYQASRKQTPEFKYPIYKLPTDFNNWKDPQPERAMLEGTDGLQGATGPLAGNEIFWMRDRFEVILLVLLVVQILLTAVSAKNSPKMAKSPLASLRFKGLPAISKTTPKN
jgi:membrane-bound lytic murein transglycosylase A